MRDVLVCLKTGDGTVKWRVDFVKKFGTPLPDFGFVCSPLVIENSVYVQAGAGTVKLDKETGEVQWRTMNDKGGMYGSAFSSPVFATLGGVPQLVVQTRAELAGVDIENGTILWRQSVPAYRGMNILTPVVLGNTIFTSSYRNASFMYRVDRNDSGFSVSEIWSDKKSQGYMSTPVVVDGKLYLHQQNQKFSCLDPASSKVLWTSKKPFGQYWSLVANGHRILALDQEGELLLIDANPEAFTLLDRRKITDQDTWAHVAVAGDQIFVRELNAITAYRWSKHDTVSLIKKSVSGALVHESNIE
jgi:outer membrane protein assembly factor BamB